jgi:hypothetical protein
VIDWIRQTRITSHHECERVIFNKLPLSFDHAKVSTRNEAVPNLIEQENGVVV